MLFAKEAHSGSVCVVTEQDPEGRFVYTDETWSVKPPGGYDSVITNDPEILLCLRTADCIPVFLYDPAEQVIAMAHSGWRGTLQGIAVRAGHHCAQPALRALGYEMSVRPTFALYNTREDVDKLVMAIKKIIGR